MMFQSWLWSSLSFTMVSAKLVIVLALVASISVAANGAILDSIFPRIMADFYNFAPTEEGYRFDFKEPNGSTREERGIVMNPGTPDEQLVVMGMYGYYDEKTDLETMTVYTADKDGYKARYMIKNRKLSANALKSNAG